MKRLWRLLYYARRYTLQAVSAVILAAGVGLLDAFRVLLIGPIFDNVLHPGAASRANKTQLLGSHRRTLAHPSDAADSGAVVPAHQNDWGVIAVRLCGLDAAERHLRLRGHLPRELRRLWHDHRHARRPVRVDPAPVGRLLSEAHHGHAALGADQRHRASAVRDIDDAVRLPAAGLSRWPSWSSIVIALGGKLAWVLPVFCPDRCLVHPPHRARCAPHHAARPGQARRYPEHSARDHHRQSHREGLQHGVLGAAALPPGGEEALPGQSALGARAGDYLAAAWTSSEPSPLPRCCGWDATRSGTEPWRRASSSPSSWRCSRCTTRSGASGPTTTISSRRSALPPPSSTSWTTRTRSAKRSIRRRSRDSKTALRLKT